HFRAKYPRTRIPGAYRIEARVRGASQRSGVYEQLVRKTVLVLPRPDLDASRISIDDGGKGIRIRIAPADRHGQRLGPGFAEQVQLTVDGQTRGSVRDLDDGSYEIEVDDLERADQHVSLWVAGEPLFRGSLARLTGR
ncbi:MAG: hypothetical protein AB1Z98_09495, partial [Nannocystaceae bacterium]